MGDTSTRGVYELGSAGVGSRTGREKPLTGSGGGVVESPLGFWDRVFLVCIGKT